MASPTAPSALGYALLCALHKKPLTGYQVVRRMSRPIGYYWTARQSQIYPELTKLTEAGLITSTAETGPGPHQKRTHELTEAGRRELAAWLIEPPAQPPNRDELILKTYALSEADPTAMRALYLAEAERHETQLADYQQQRADLADSGATEPSHPEFGSYATVEMGIRREQYRAEWCRWLAGKL